MRKNIITFLWCCLSALTGVQAALLTGFTQEDWSVSPPGSWTISEDVAYEEVGAHEPTVYYSPYDSLGTRFTGTFGVGQNLDDDFIGFVVGFTPGSLANDSANSYLLIDWKRATQAIGDGYTAALGLAISHVSGRPDDAFQGFWGHEGDVQELSRGMTLGSSGWVTGTSYNYVLDYTTDSISFSVNDVLQFTLSAEDLPGSPSSLSEGRFGFYACSQDDANFSISEVVAIPEPATALLLVFGGGVAWLARLKQHL